MKRWLVGLAVLLGLGAVGGTGLYYVQQRTNAASSLAPPKNQAVARKSASFNLRGVGENLRYSVAYSANAGGIAQGEALTIKLDGELQLTCLRLGSEDLTYRAEWQGSALVSRDAAVETGECRA